MYEQVWGIWAHDPIDKKDSGWVRAGSEEDTGTEAWAKSRAKELSRLNGGVYEAKPWFTEGESVAKIEELEEKLKAAEAACVAYRVALTKYGDRANYVPVLPNPKYSWVDRDGGETARQTLSLYNTGAVEAPLEKP